MDRDTLLALREEIVNRTREIALEGDIGPSEKLQLLMGLIASGNSTPDLLRKAYELSNQLPEDSDKLDTMLELIFAIDGQLSTINGDQYSDDDTQTDTDSPQ